MIANRQLGHELRDWHNWSVSDHLVDSTRKKPILILKILGAKLNIYVVFIEGVPEFAVCRERDARAFLEERGKEGQIVVLPLYGIEELARSELWLDLIGVHRGTNARF